MNVAKYRKKPVVIEAILMEFNQGNSLQEIADWCGGRAVGGDRDRMAVIIPTLEGLMRVKYRDYIIKGVQGEFYPCKPDIFEATYEKVLEK